MEYVNDVHGKFVVKELAETPCQNGNILFGQGTLNEIPASYFHPLNSDAFAVLEKWSKGCKIPATERSLQIGGFFNGTDGVKILVTSKVIMTLREWLSKLNNPSVGIEGLEYMRVWNQYSCSLCKAKYYNLFSEAEDLMIGENHDIVIPFKFKTIDNSNRFNWFDEAYMNEMRSMNSIYLNHKPYEGSSRTLEILFENIQNDPTVLHYFRIQTIPLFYDVESFDAYLVRNLDNVQIHWDNNPNNLMDYGGWIEQGLGITGCQWEEDVLNGLHGDDWRDELITWNVKFRKTNNLPLPLIAKNSLPKNKRNCPMVFVIFARNRLTHGVTAASLRILSKAELLRRLDEIIPGAIMQFFVEAIKRRNNGLLMTRGW